MKKFLVILTLTVLGYQSFSQILYIQSKDSINGHPKMEVGFGGWIKLSLIYDAVGIETTAALNPFYIPTGDYTPDPQFAGDMRQSRLMFVGRHSSKKLGLITGYIEGDFYGAGAAGFRLRHAYIKGKRLLVGQYWSAFTDTEVWPNVADFDGPPTGIWKRMPQVRYMQEFSGKYKLAISLETSLPEYRRLIDTLFVDEPNQNIPNLAGQIAKNLKRGHIALSGIFRNIRYKDLDSSDRYLQGFGLALSGLIELGKDKFIYQLTGGKGIASYMSSFGGIGLDVVIMNNTTKELIPTWGGYLSYQHFWGNSDFSSNILFGWAIFNNKWFDDYQDSFYGTHSSVNLNWVPTKHISSFLEIQYGTHVDITGQKGDAFRLMLTAEYSF